MHSRNLGWPKSNAIHGMNTGWCDNELFSSPDPV